MVSLYHFAQEKVENILEPYGQIDVLLLSAVVSQKLSNYLADHELATIVWLPSARIPYLVKRGSKMKPLFVKELADGVTVDFLELRSEIEDLSEVKDEITDQQEKIWNYFVPRKYVEFHYAANGEGRKKPIDRLFFDLDRGQNISAKQAQQATKLLIQVIREDEDFAELIANPKPFVYWTGNSFHIYFFFEEEKSPTFYAKYFKHAKDKPEASFTGRWAAKVNEQTDFRVVGGHERLKDTFIIDPSQTPSGKLSRIPLGSLHMKDGETVDGISIPITVELLEKEDLVEELTSIGPRAVIKNLGKFAKRLPKELRSD